jgi:hypothetical protein
LEWAQGSTSVRVVTRRFRPPGAIDDFARRPELQDAFERGWDAVVTYWVDQAEQDGSETGGNFFNPHRDETPGEPLAQPVAWDAFPRFLEKWFEDEDGADEKRWQTAETLRPNLFGGKPLRRVRDGNLAESIETFHRQQDEYCEWFVHRDDAGAITRVAFTSEAPEYWRFLAGGTRALLPEDHPDFALVDGDIELVAELYRIYVDESVTAADLVWPYDVASWYGRNAATGRWYIHRRKGDYNEFNRWNTTHGAMHLTHPANTLGAEINLAANATVLREDGDGRRIEDTEALICCSGYGEPNRSSDPSIGSGVNGFARDGLSVALADPVGLYIATINLGAFSGPAGEDVGAGWRVDRGSPEQRMILRGTFAAPEASGLRVEDILARGNPIAFGGQIADEIQMTLTGLAKDRGVPSRSPQRCSLKCCESPDRPGIETIVGIDADCSTVAWDELAPYVAGAAPELVAPVLDEPADLVSAPPPVVAPSRAAR